MRATNGRIDRGPVDFYKGRVSGGFAAKSRESRNGAHLSKGLLAAANRAKRVIRDSGYRGRAHRRSGNNGNGTPLSAGVKSAKSATTDTRLQGCAHRSNDNSDTQRTYLDGMQAASRVGESWSNAQNAQSLTASNRGQRSNAGMPARRGTMVKLNDIQKAKLVLEAHVGLTTIANVYAGRPVRSMQRQLIEEAAKKMGLPMPPPVAA